MHSDHHRTHTPQEMETVKGGRIILGLEINLILFYVGATRECMVFVHQPPYLEVAHTQGAATIQCSFSHTGCPSVQPKSLWFRYGTDQTENLCLDGCTGDAGKFTVKEALTERAVSLTVNRVALNDSAIYICGIVFLNSKEPGAKRTGEGTILVVREMKELHSPLIAAVSVLSIYVTGALVIFIILSKSKSNSLRNKETGYSQKKKSARRIFQEIAQELYSKRQVETRQPPEKGNTYENRRALSNYERP
ncbi:immunoglobulin superfamily member 6 isoform X2 [Callorhinus ursinus]|uniref:immunoglobulin superfamily member 6 isoform X2 n=1 Tax=Callorhinus ursinus TaxID=34884 RepID=UPI000DEE788C|nr:immunoglobulin superfamily member 6 isoform X2 [Callorhinus ursinus]